MVKDGRKFRVSTAKKQRKSDRSLSIIFPSHAYERMTASFTEQHKANFEGYAIALCGLKAGPTTKSVTYMVRSLHIPSKEDFIEHSSVSVTPTAEFMEPILCEASEHNSTVLEIHTHPGSESPNFSSVDLDHGLENGKFLKTCKISFGMIVIGSEGFSIMEYEADSDSLQVPHSAGIAIIARSGLENILPRVGISDNTAVSVSHDRQVRMWGEECQRKIAGMTVGIAGLGGTGSVVLQMLARIGVKKFALCDPDVVEESNLNRIPFTFDTDVGRKKTKVATGYLKKIADDVKVRSINGRIQDSQSFFNNCDMIFGCVDNDAARLSLNSIALRYFIPYIDTGTEIFLEDGNVKDLGGQVRIVVPAVTGCLDCAGAIDHELAAAGFLSDDELAIHNNAGYVRGTNLTPAPAVITLNTMIASLAVQEFVDMVSGRDRQSFQNYLLYDASLPIIERLSFERNESCPMCGSGSILGAGDLQRTARSRVKMIRQQPG